MPADFELTAECLACILRQVLEACEEASKDTRLRYQAVRDAVMYLNTVGLDGLDHVRAGSDLHRIARQTTGNPDPHHELKKTSSRVALEWLSKAKASVHSNPSFIDAVSIAACGNMIDYGATSTSESPAALIAKAMDTRIDPEAMVLEESSQEFLKVFNDADLIVSKGQGNLESLVRINRKPTTVYISKVKCDPIAKRFGCKVGSTMVAIEKTESTKHRPDGVS